jgi:glycosyltransferase involved in cell wall biosynthesis
MLKIVSVSDKVGTAIDRLCRGVAPYHDNINYVTVDVHPKRPSIEQLRHFEDEAQTADIIDWQYFRTAEMLRSRYSWLNDRKNILTHNNPYSIKESNWNNYDLVIGNNKEITANLKKITQSRVDYIPLTIDSNFWEYQREFKHNNRVIMVANRIEAKKGILPVAIACAELNIRMTLVGAISDRDYMQAIDATGVVDFYEQVDDEKLRELYYDSMLHVCNSVDNFESGTLPILEAMFCGVPVLTRKVGHVPDIYNGDNMLINDKDSEDVVRLIDTLHDAIADKKRLDKIREAAWNSVKNRNNERRAFAYQRAYRSVMYDTESVSVIVPINKIDEHAHETLNAIANQTYKNIEIVVCDDGGNNNGDVTEFAKYLAIPVRHVITARGDYGLARARNEGAIEATGDVLVFVDQRIKMNPDAIEIFMQELRPKTWLYGTKGVKKDFVENFSCIRKEDFITFGMFSERMDCYGGLSEETRVRARGQGMQIRCIERAVAVAQGSSKNKYTKKQEIIRAKNRLYKMGVQ